MVFGRLIWSLVAKPLGSAPVRGIAQFLPRSARFGAVHPLNMNLNKLESLPNEISSPGSQKMRGSKMVIFVFAFHLQKTQNQLERAAKARSPDMDTTAGFRERRSS